MEIKVKEKIVRNESVEIKTETTKFNLTKSKVLSLSTPSLSFGGYSVSELSYYDDDFGEISVTFTPKTTDQATNAREALHEVAKLYRGDI